MYCDKCGNKLNEGAIFCDKCGSRVTDLSDQSQFAAQNGGSPKDEPQSDYGSGFTAEPYNQPAYSYQRNTEHIPQNPPSAKSYRLTRLTFFEATKDPHIIKMRRALNILSAIILIIYVLGAVFGYYTAEKEMFWYDYIPHLRYMLLLFSGTMIPTLILISCGLIYSPHFGLYIGAAITMPISAVPFIFCPLVLSEFYSPGSDLFIDIMSYLRLFFIRIFPFMIMIYAVVIAALVVSLVMNKKYKAAQLNISRQLN